MSRIKFYQGAIPSEILSAVFREQIRSGKEGGLNYFIGIVRSDIVNDQIVDRIEFSIYEALAEKEIKKIINEAQNKFDCASINVYHSIGEVKVNEICLLVTVSAGHRKASIKGTDFVVDEVKKRAPIFGKEIFKKENELSEKKTQKNKSYQWKENKF